MQRKQRSFAVFQISIYQPIGTPQRKLRFYLFLRL
nr:MAG TPA: hypothetical protein [Caudoviricetes sp.]